MPVLEDSKLEALFTSFTDLKGDVAEVGVHRGATFKRMLKLARPQNRVGHAFDSFRGMGKPGEFDHIHTEQGLECQYPEGKFDIGGVQTFIDAMNEAGFTQGIDYFTWPGFVPEGFRQFDRACLDRVGFVLCLIDLDHYFPTVETLAWAWPKIQPGGVMVLDDYFPGNPYLATRAIEEWLGTYPAFCMLGRENGQLLVKKKRI